jgi:hypothetical protein
MSHPLSRYEVRERLAIEAFVDELEVERLERDPRRSARRAGSAYATRDFRREWNRALREASRLGNLGEANY